MIIPLNLATFNRIKNSIDKINVEGMPSKHGVFYFEDDSSYFFYMPYDFIIYQAKIEKQEIVGEKETEMINELIRYSEQIPEKPHEKAILLKLSIG